MAEVDSVTGGPRPRQPSDLDRERLRQLDSQLRRGGTVRYVDYAAAEGLAARLAVRLLEIVPPEELARSSFLPLPRGGFIVLGMLLYQLGRSVPTRRESQPGEPVIVVDDCTLSGARFASALATLDAPRVYFAHLLSNGELRRAIEESEPRVRCIAAADLESAAPSAQEVSLQERWQSRLGQGRYGFVPIQPVAFAWSEPSWVFFNQVSGRLESGWHFVPPHRCLAHFGRLGPPPDKVANPRWRIPDGVVWGEFDGVRWLIGNEGREVVALEGAAASIWARIARHGDPVLIADELAAALDAPPDVLCQDIESLIAELSERGLLEPAGDRDGSVE